MLSSATRVLTTHAGSLPRSELLVELFARRKAGGEVDEDILESAIDEAMARCVRRQIAAGIDIVSNGEQSRDGFLTYLPDRLTGFGGRADRPLRRDLVRYPQYQAQFEAWLARRTAVSNFNVPQAIGPVRYKDAQVIVEEC